MPPVIGIIPAAREDGEVYLPHAYQRALERSGGESLILPLTKDKDAISRSTALCSGFLFIGGPDPDPRLYGEEPDGRCRVILTRDENDRGYFEVVFNSGKPILGICRGLQIINVLLGGTLFFDLPEAQKSGVLHGKDGKIAMHGVAVKKKSPLWELTELTRLTVNSLHHQGVRRPGVGLLPMARSYDGLTEAVYHVSHPYLRAYQWHPERSFDSDTSSRAIFSDFISACNLAHPYRL